MHGDSATWCCFGRGRCRKGARQCRRSSTRPAAVRLRLARQHPAGLLTCCCPPAPPRRCTSPCPSSKLAAPIVAYVSSLRCAATALPHNPAGVHFPAQAQRRLHQDGGGGAAARAPRWQHVHVREERARCDQVRRNKPLAMQPCKQAFLQRLASYPSAQVQVLLTQLTDGPPSLPLCPLTSASSSLPTTLQARLT